MSDTLQIGLVAEGLTDWIVIEAALQAIIPNRPFVLTQLQPEGSVAFGELGSGWPGVYRWCKQAALRGKGRLSDDKLLFSRCELLLLHLDADVAGKKYADATIPAEPGDGVLPCEAPCPPAAATTNALRRVLMTWCGEAGVPARTVVCMPSKSTEAWVMAALFPRDARMARHGECLSDPELRLSQQPKKVRIKKRQSDYRDHAPTIVKEWPRIASAKRLGEAVRFHQDVVAAVASLP